MEMVMVNIPPKLFRYFFVALVSMKNRRQYKLLPTDLLNGATVGFFIKGFCKLIPAVLFKVGGVDVKNHFVNDKRVLSKSSCADGLVGKQGIKHLLITAARLFEMDVEGGAVFVNAIVHIVGVLPLVVALPNT